MNDLQLKTTLQAISKKCFLNCYERAEEKNGDVSVQDIMECNPDFHYSLPTAKTKRSGIRRIFRAGRQAEAMEICNKSRAGAWVSKKQVIHNLVSN